MAPPRATEEQKQAAKAKRREAANAKYSAAKAAGTCVRCFKAPAAKDLTVCPDCLNREQARGPQKAEKDKARYAAKRAAGVCIQCGDLANTGGVYCQTCADARNAETAAEREQRRAAAAQTRAAEDKSRYDSFKAAGICPACAKEPKCETSVYCSGCLDKQRQRQGALGQKRKQQKTQSAEQRQDARRSEGLCVECGKVPADFREDRCRLCWSRFTARSGVAYYEARKAAGLCSYCNELVYEDGTSLCETHRAAKRERFEQRKAENLCTTCSRPNDNLSGGNLCSACRESRQKRRQQRRTERVCTVCVKPLTADDRAMCPGCAAKNAEKQRKAAKLLREQVLAEYGGVCKCCGETEPKFLHVDHVFNDGAEHRRSIGGRNEGCNLYKWLKRNGFPKDRFQLLCANCNFAKGHYGQCPHELSQEPSQ